MELSPLSRYDVTETNIDRLAAPANKHISFVVKPFDNTLCVGTYLKGDSIKMLPDVDHLHI